MEVKPGYKMTEVGFIPDDWKAIALKVLGFDISDGNYSSKYPKSSDFCDFGIPFIRANNIGKMKILDEDLRYISKAQHSGLLKGHLKKGDILITTRGDIGQVAFVPDGHVGSNINAQLVRINTDNSLCNHRFLGYVLTFSSSQKQFENLQTGSALKQLPVGKLTSLVIPLPASKAEQEAIASALSDVDALIESLEQLVAKKRNIKQGAMQELFCPKIGWNTAKLGDLGTFSKGNGVRRDQSLSGDLPCIRYGEIYTQHDNFVKEFYSWISPEVAASARRLRQGDILFAGSGETKEEIGKCVAFVEDVEAYAGGDIVILSLAFGDSLFWGYCLNTSSVCRQKASRGQGDAVVHITASALAEIEVTFPSVQDQRNIATVLFDMDVELASLESKLTKARHLKQAMMQELLTGRIRLV